MTSSGTEASMSAIRLARAATGREKILKFAGAYHGHVDGLLAEAGSGLATQGIPASPGVPAAAAARHDRRPWNDPEAVSRAAARARAGGDPRGALPGQHGPGPAGAGLPRAPARARRTRRARCWSSTRSSAASASPGRRAGALRSPPRPGRHGQGDRRRPPGGGVRRPARADGADRAGRRRLPGGHAVGEPARGRGRARHAADARRRRLRPPRAHDRELADGLREAAARPAPCRSSRCPAS